MGRFFLTLLLFIVLVPFIAKSQWVQMLNSPGGTFVLAVNDANLFAATHSDGIFFSTDSGASWKAVNIGLPKNPDYPSNYVPIYALMFNKENTFAGSGLKGIFRSTNNGDNWFEVNEGLTDLNVSALVANGNNLFAGTHDSGVFLSTNNGMNWVQMNYGLTNTAIRTLVSMGRYLFAGTSNAVFLSNDTAKSWKVADTVTMKYTGIESFAVCDSILFAATVTGVFRSTNKGASWDTISPIPSEYPFYSIEGVKSNLFAGSWGYGVYLSTDYGATWSNVSTGLPMIPSPPFRYFNAWDMVVFDQSLIAALNGGNMYRRPLSQMITSAVFISKLAINKFNLSQNYPNPFNPTTTIKFHVAHSGFIRLKVFDMLGREATTLVNEEMQSGSYERTFDGSNLSSGIYFYQMRAGDFVETKKLMLLR